LVQTLAKGVNARHLKGVGFRRRWLKGEVNVAWFVGFDSDVDLFLSAGAKSPSGASAETVKEDCENDVSTANNLVRRDALSIKARTVSWSGVNWVSLRIEVQPD